MTGYIDCHKPSNELTTSFEKASSHHILMKKITSRFNYGIFNINQMFVLVYLISSASQIHGNLKPVTKTPLKFEALRSGDYNLWTSPGIMDGLFTSTPGVATSSNLQEAKEVKYFSLYHNGPQIAKPETYHTAPQELKSQRSLPHDIDNLGEKAGPTSINEKALMGHTSHPQLLSSSDQQQEATGLLFKDIVKIKPPGDYLKNHHAQAHPASPRRTSSSSKKVDGNIMTKSDPEEDVPSNMGSPNIPSILNVQTESKASKVNIPRDNENKNQKVHQLSGISAQEVPNKNNMMISGHIGDRKVYSKAPKFSGGSSSRDMNTTTKIHSQNLNSFKQGKMRLEVSPLKAYHRSTEKLTKNKGMSYKKGMNMIPYKAKFQEEKVNDKVLDDKNFFKALEDFNEALDDKDLKANPPMTDQKQEIKNTSENKPDNEDTEKLIKQKADYAVVDTAHSNGNTALGNDTENANHVEEDPNAEVSSAQQEGDEGEDEPDVDEVEQDDLQEMSESGKASQRRSKTAKNKKGKKSHKSKKGKNTSIQKHTSIPFFDSEFLDSTDHKPSKKQSEMSREELFKVDQSQFLRHFLKSRNNTPYLPIILGDMEFEYLMSLKYTESGVWDKLSIDFTNNFEPWREGIRRVACLDEQFKEKYMVWKWKNQKHTLPKYAQNFVESLKPDEEFVTFRDATLHDWQAYSDRKNYVLEHDENMIQTVFGILGEMMEKRIVTLNLMSHHSSDLVESIIDSGAIREGIDLPIIITFDQSLCLSHEDGWLDDTDKEDIQYHAVELIEAMNGRVSGYDGEEYFKSDCSWLQECTRAYITKPGSRIAKLVEERIKALANRADHLKVPVPKALDAYIPPSIKGKGLSLGDILLSTHAGLDLESLVKLKAILKWDEFKDPKTRTKPLNRKQTKCIGDWESIRKDFASEADDIKRYCDLKDVVIRNLNAYIARCNMQGFL
ncbi:uncharacterized protein MELLADRAFT_66461 [Melampsora larici-populina 98AG31]|uniref:Uncharacterized protein n=1 Tax=Melampsora larici-populina (strain 98AG31 / pathotype 3-4-7) TaxID=747676 RepID=F4RZA6_MELLP|nr:uncharacterized protein MELLADRAFT_66461 [Melampsora larici-populina 98AG31]EGG02285.1 hypothetical protein MELLADRAFT_66461 [Melampsora larici-populina 98AG31]